MWAAAKPETAKNTLQKMLEGFMAVAVILSRSASQVLIVLAGT